jgi:hypothetical protein
MLPVWKEIFKLTLLCDLGCNMIVGNGAHTLFWLDIWHSYCALATSFYHLFTLYTNPKIIVFEVVLSRGQAL